MNISWNKLRLAIVALGLLAVATACSLTEMERNQAGIRNLRKGMSKDEVSSMMGQPLTGEVYNQPNVWYYYTDRRWADGAITNDECTPVVFENDRVVGWGHDFLKQHRFEKW